MPRWIGDTLRPERATIFLRALGTQQPVIDRDARRELEWVARGRHAILFGPSGSILVQLTQQGLRFGVGGELKDIGGMVAPSTGSIMLLKHAPHPDAAKVFINWLLTREGQTDWGQGGCQASRRLDVPRDHLLPGTTPKPGVAYGLFTGRGLQHTPELARLVDESFAGR